MALMTPQEYIESLRKLNTRVYMFGEKIDNWVDHPMIRPSINCVAMTYALAQDPRYEELMTATSRLTGRKINRFTHLHQSADDLDYVQNSYYYVIRNISYDNDKAENTPTDYVPDIDTILEEKKGICFDYASLMAALLRSQSIPTKLEVGYSGEAYHAWISVYLTESGWVDNIIEFDGKDWVLMDPTLAANNSSKAVAKYIGDGSKYTVKYSY